MSATAEPSSANSQGASTGLLFPVAGALAINALIVSAPLVLFEFRRWPLLPWSIFAASSSMMCLAEFRHSTRYNESLTAFGAYQYAALMGSLLLLLTKWSSLMELTLAHNVTSHVSLATGAALVTSGAALRSISMKSLGSRFCSQTSCSVLVTDGIFALVRHPSESGLLLVSLGFTVMMSAWTTAVLMLPMTLAASLFRISLEERELRRSYGADYAAYCRQAGCLIPASKLIRIHASRIVR